MTASGSRHIALAGTFNIRDLGGYATIDGGSTAWRRMLRSDSLHKLDEAGVEALLSHGLVAVIDLRHGNELESAPNPFATRQGVHYTNINLLADLMPRADAVYEDDIDVLLELYVRTIDERRPLIREALEAIASAPEGAVLFHCAAGKDRTGIMAAILLGIAGVQRDLILDDYELTAIQIKPALADYERRALERGQDLRSLHAIMASRRETMSALLDHIDARYGGLTAYLDEAGLAPAHLARLRSRILQIETVQE
jgi:protein-tyrosine phosphatase